MHTIFSPVSSSAPLTSGGIPESLPLSWEVSVSSWNTEEERIVLLELGSSDLWVVTLVGWCVHLLYILAYGMTHKVVGKVPWLGLHRKESQGHWQLLDLIGMTEVFVLPEEVCLDTSLCKTFFLCQCNLLNVTIHGVLGI